MFNFFKKKNKNKDSEVENIESIEDDSLKVDSDVADESENTTESEDIESIVESEKNEESVEAAKIVNTEESVKIVNTEESAGSDNNQEKTESETDDNIKESDTPEEKNKSETEENVAWSESDEETAESDNEVETLEETKKEKKGMFARLKEGLFKTRDNLSKGLSGIFSGFSELNDDFYEELEEILIMADIGVTTTENIIESLQERAKEEKIKSAEDCKNLLKSIIKEQMSVGENEYEFENEKSVILMVGVNGAGKTTTCGKIASQLKNNKKRVLLAAADTFRAAAIEQLTTWANRAGVEIVAGSEGTDPASVVFDSISAAKARNADVLLCDTAGRLQNKNNLMKELEKINRIIDREYPEAHKETFIVLDATTGQNALSQAREFSSVTDITGIILTKLDGTAKGGVVIAIQSELKIPVKYIGVGEGIMDLQKFDADSFVEALFDQ